MSRVFLAEEVALARQVVIKVLPPDMAAGVNQERFRREVQLAARLQHPHIVPLLSAGSDGDLLYYVMPYIEGESLRVKLGREAELPVAETVRILREVTDALAYAHDKGVVHRDIKPDNVMLSSGHALVTDFGVAKAVTDAAGVSSLTSLGMALGTPAYMSPEQAAGSTSVDHRADLYALGAMAHEMLTGTPPFTGANPQAVLAAHVTQTPTGVRATRPAVPPALEAVIMRCLEKHAADRWQRATELLPEFDGLLTPSGSSQPTTATASISSGTEAALRQAHPIRVVLLFALAAILALGATWWLMQQLGLPTWVLFGAGVLLLAGLPIILIAARHERRRLQARGTGQVAPTPVGLLAPLTTWRGAFAGGALAFGGLAAGTALFMTLRALGVGPFATLVTAGVLNQRDPLILAEFANRTGDSTLAASITEAFRIDLAQSRTVRLVGPDVVAGTLQLMHLDPATHLTEEVARDISARIGAKGVVAGEIASLAGGYVLSVRLVNADDGSTLLAGRETADGASGIIAAVEKLSRKLRADIGESLRSIRDEPPLAEVTTGSLAALRAYTDGSRAADEARDAEAVRLLEQAVGLDSNFAMAWRKLGVALGHLGNDREAEVAAITRAYRLRDRLSPREATHIEAYYFTAVLRSGPQAIQAYERLITAWPDDDIALVNLGELYGSEGRLEEMERLDRTVTELGQFDAITLTDLLGAQSAQGKTAAADSTLALWAEKLPGNLERLRAAMELARARGEYDRALDMADSLAHTGDPHWRTIAHRGAAKTLIRLGRLRESQGRSLQAIAEADRARETVSGLEIEMDQAQTEILVLNQPEAGLRRIGAALARLPLDSLAPGNRPYGRLVALYAMAGRIDTAQALQGEYERVVPEQLRNNEWAAYGLGHLALARGDERSALAHFRRARVLWWCRTCTLLEEGLAFERAGQVDSALASYQGISAHEIWAYQRAMKDFAVPLAYQRLGELYENKGDTVNALEAYGNLTALWKDADPVLQVRVQEIKRRMAALVAEPH